MKTHHLKTWPKYFQAIKSGDKTFELRKNDRGFEVGDTLFLHEFDNEIGQITGADMTFQISYILNLGDYLKTHTDYVILGLR